MKKSPEGTELEHVEIEDSEQQSSIEISKNAKGEYAWKTKTYADPTEDAKAKAKAFKKIAIDLAKD